MAVGDFLAWGCITPISPWWSNSFLIPLDLISCAFLFLIHITSCRSTYATQNNLITRPLIEPHLWHTFSQIRSCYRIQEWELCSYYHQKYLYVFSPNSKCRDNIFLKQVRMSLMSQNVVSQLPEWLVLKCKLYPSQWHTFVSFFSF